MIAYVNQGQDSETLVKLANNFNLQKS